MKIYAPVKDFNGLRNNIRFVNGVGETTDSRMIEWFKSHGYEVENEASQFTQKVQNDYVEKIDDQIIDDSGFVDLNKLVEDEPDFDSMNPNELRDWAKANGFGGMIKNTRNKEKLIEILRG